MEKYYGSTLAKQKPQTTFAVPLHCEGCVKDVSGALNKLEGSESLLLHAETL